MIIGLISDTHLPDRLDQIPPVAFEVLDGADLILHAGDVGELRVLDQLCKIAPVIAVHGNDDTEESQRELPYAQVVFAYGQRILLTHAHYPNRPEELASRRSDDWESRLERRAKMAQRAGASIVVFGHTHIPMLTEYLGVTCINPGAIAAGNFVTRQAIQTVAMMEITPNGRSKVVHYNLENPKCPFDVSFDLSLGFRAQSQRYTPFIISPELQAKGRELANDYIAKFGEYAFWRRLRPLAFKCWRGEVTEISDADIMAALEWNDNEHSG